LENISKEIDRGNFAGCCITGWTGDRSGDTRNNFTAIVCPKEKCFVEASLSDLLDMRAIVSPIALATTGVALKDWIQHIFLVAAYFH
jgi:hypothetical protein